MREKLIELLCHALNKYNPCIYCVGEEHCDEVNIIVDHLVANGVTVRERGEWELPSKYGFSKHYDWGTVCSVCEGWNEVEGNFCHNCGADMRGEEHESD